MSERRKGNYPCGCQFDDYDLGDPAPEHCPSHGEPKRLLCFPVVEIPGCPQCKEFFEEIELVFVEWMNSPSEGLNALPRLFVMIPEERKIEIVHSFMRKKEAP